jgi:hypothetical protein
MKEKIDKLSFCLGELLVLPDNNSGLLSHLITPDADPPSLLRAAQPPGLGSIKKLSLIDSLGLC